MINYDYDATQYKENNYQLIPAGDHRVRVEEAEEQLSKSGLEMVKLTLKVSGYSGRLFYYLVVHPSYMQWTHQKFGEFFESFGVRPGDMNILNWKGKVGAARVKHGSYEGEPKAEVAYFLPRKKQDSLAPWCEPGDYARAGDELSSCPF